MVICRKWVIFLHMVSLFFAHGFFLCTWCHFFCTWVIFFAQDLIIFAYGSFFCTWCHFFSHGVIFFTWCHFFCTWVIFFNMGHFFSHGVTFFAHGSFFLHMVSFFFAHYCNHKFRFLPNLVWNLSGLIPKGNRLVPIGLSRKRLA